MKSAAMSRAMRMKRAHDEKISFCPASGSVQKLLAMACKRVASCSKEKYSLTIWICVGRISFYNRTVSVSKSRVSITIKVQALLCSNSNALRALSAITGLYLTGYTSGTKLYALSIENDTLAVM